MANGYILIGGAHQNNLKHLNLRLPLNELIVVTGVSGSGKSSLAFDTVYAEGQRRYVETFSPYARQFLDRMDKPRVDRIEGIPPAIAIDQTNPVRTSRSTVGTMTELNDHIKLLFARAARLHCRGCGQPVQRDSPDSIYDRLSEKTVSAPSPAVQITFPLRIPDHFSREEVEALLAQQGYTRTQRRQGAMLEVVQDRVRLAPDRRDRVLEALETALQYGRGQVHVYLLDEARRAGELWRFSEDLHCPDCDIHYREPMPNLFSFNSPMGACDTCRGFGRIIGIDDGLVIPDETKTLAGGAVKPWQTPSYRECQDDLMRFARKDGVPTNVAWRNLSESQRRWVLEGEGAREDGLWYGVRRFFDWLETKSYKMHIRVLLSKYRAYTPCTDCQGARLKPEALSWRLGTLTDADEALPRERRFKPDFVSMSAERYGRLAGLTVHDIMLLSIDRCRGFFGHLHLPAPLDEATDLLLGEIRARLNYLVEVGLGYLTLDRQSRTLSGGEVQRINLTTALGTSLVNTLFVLDEPSIGLHPRDMQRVIGILQRLRDAGNSLLVVEHDPQVMLAADRVLDLGPGPGERGGKVVFFDRPEALLSSENSVTAQYLTGKKTVVGDPDSPLWKRTAGGDFQPSTPCLEILGASEHNLKHIDVRIPLNRLVCVTGVSGSGKSTLVQGVIYNALRKLKAKPMESPGRHRALHGHEYLEDVVLVDQSPIGKTARANPASYVGALNAIRKLFAAEPLAVERGYTPATFSFNSGNGRCPTCRGNGFEHVEMQFLSDVYLRCPDCDGRRYRPEVLEVKLFPANGACSSSIADVLEMTISQAMTFFADHRDVLKALEPLAAVGLGYLTLGQPVPTLSGGEAQRLKLVRHLVNNRNIEGSGTLFLFDEPTTGLHFDDIAKLLRAFRRLIGQGHSLLVIEHNLDVIQAADWVIDLGPEGGERGGALVCTGTPDEVMRCQASHTGAALLEYARPRLEERHPADARDARGNGSIRIHNAREHNLKNVEITIPRNELTVITGVSGSGKSTVAFNILFGEGQRRYLQSLNAYARQFVQPSARPDVDAVLGIPPTVAIEQRISRGGRKSTVATLTEIYHFLRLLFVKLGTQYCPDCEIPIEPQTPAAILARIFQDHRGHGIQLLAPLVTARKGYYTELAKWAAAKGFPGLRVDGEFMPTNDWPRLDRFKAHDIELPVGELIVTPEVEAELRALLERALAFGKGVVMVKGGLSESLFSTERACPGCGRGFEALDPRLFSFNSKHGWCASCYGTGLMLPGFDERQTGEKTVWNVRGESEERACPGCDGGRLRPEALAVRFQNRSIAEYTALPVETAEQVFRAMALTGREAEVARDMLAELRGRLRFLREVGLSYLSLDRAAPTLSGGEAQRIRLASQLGSNLRGVCYILDEPTIGLHPRDNRLLLDTLGRLREKGNTVVVVEHDEETIRRAGHVVDLGPRAGIEGGRVVAEGTVDELLRNPRSLTGRFLAHPLPHPLTKRRARGRNREKLEIKGACLHNLKDLDLEIPLGGLVCVTGVSGSGKSTLSRDVIHDSLRKLLTKKQSRKNGRADAGPRSCREIRGWQGIGRVMEVDQTPIGKTPRSCPATYVGFWDAIRRLFAETPEAKIRGYQPGRFSFNVRGGRCDACDGQGFKKIEMSFLPDVRVACEACTGARFNTETLAVRYKSKTIADVLAMSIDEAVDFFAAHRSLHHVLTLLQDVGLGYLTLGQQSPTLSGGEAQRIKLVTELAKARNSDTALRAGKEKHDPSRAANASLYLLDEPTVGLHMADVEKLIHVLHRLVDVGNTVIVVEHNLDIIAEADWIVDLGPEGGAGGGRIVAQGMPENVARHDGSHTGRFLKEFLAERGVSL